MSTQDLPRPSASEGVPVFKCLLCPGPLVGEGRETWLWVQLGVTVLSSAHALAEDSWFGSVSLKSNSLFH